MYVGSSPARGTTLHNPMGRKRRHNKKQKRMEQQPLSYRERELINRATREGFAIPWQYRNWPNCFTSLDSFITSMTGWLEGKIRNHGEAEQIVTDKWPPVRKPEVKTPAPNLSRTTHSKMWNGWSEDDYEWDQRSSSVIAVMQTLPAAPLIPAPSGLSCEQEPHVVL